jgi:hypothetical protein
MWAITYKHFHKLVFPVYFVPTDNWERRDGLLFLDNKLVDDKNIDAETLGMRRLRTPFKDLMPLRKALETEMGLIKNPAGNYIDTKGRTFKYEKTKLVSLKYLLIDRVDLKETASVLWVKGLKRPFTLLRPPEPRRLWVGILFLGEFPWRVYEFSIAQKPNSRKKI